MIPAEGGEEKRVTFDSASETAPRFSPNGRKLYFLRSEGGPGAEDDLAGRQIFSIPLDRQAKDPDHPADPEDPLLSRDTNAADSKDVAMDWAGLKRRTRRVTRMPYSVSTYAIAPDNRTIVFAVSEPSGTGSTSVIYSIQEDGKRLTRITSSAPSSDEPEASPRGRRIGGGGRISNFPFAPGGPTLFFLAGRRVYSTSHPRGPRPPRG